MSVPSEISPAAARQREYRQRDKLATRWASAFVPSDMIDKLMNIRKGLPSSNRYMAQSRRRDLLLATLAFPGCHTSIRRPALGAAGRGHPHNRGWP